MAEKRNYLWELIKNIFIALFCRDKFIKKGIIDEIKVWTNVSDGSRYKGMKSLKELIKSGEAIAVTFEEIATQFKGQTDQNLTLHAHYNTIRPNPEDLTIRPTECMWKDFKQLEVYYRLPYDYYIEIIKRTPVDQHPYITEGRSHICNDFAAAMFSEVIMSPYYEAFCCEITIRGHRINAIWPSDRENIMWWEPNASENAGKVIWTPDFTLEIDGTRAKDNVIELIG
jgi:hypothetical protein